MSKKPRGHIVISADYDNCFDIFFGEIKHKEIKTNKEALIQKLNKDSKGAKTIRLYVGSLRQDIAHDEHNKKHFTNGSCFKNYANLCKNPTKFGLKQKKWIFEKLLLADKINKFGEKYKAGTAMRHKELSMPGNIDGVGTSNREIFNTQIKISTIQNQLNDLGKKFPAEKIDFYFYDDDYKNIIFKALKKRLKVPTNIQVHLVKYDYFLKNPIQLIGTIKPQEKVKLTKQTSIVVKSSSSINDPLLKKKKGPNQATCCRCVTM